LAWILKIFFQEYSLGVHFPHENSLEVPCTTINRFLFRPGVAEPGIGSTVTTGPQAI
jgi:hypothetical protein